MITNTASIKKPIDRNTFGSTPAAIYLAEQLNIIDNPKVLRKASAFINSCRVIIADGVRAHNNGFIGIKTLYFIVDSLSEKVKENAISVRFDPTLGDYPLVINLVTNVLIGEIKSIKRRAQEIAHINHIQAQLQGACDNDLRSVILDKNGVKLATVGSNIQLAHVGISDVKDPTNVDILVQRSKRRLSRLNKHDTLY